MPKPHHPLYHFTFLGFTVTLGSITVSENQEEKEPRQRKRSSVSDAAKRAKGKCSLRDPGQGAHSLREPRGGIHSGLQKGWFEVINPSTGAEAGISQQVQG